MREPADLLRALPGLQLSAHGGRGKAWQFLYRGFDAEHGADLAVTVDGVPLNEPSNVHAHGYADPAFIPTVAIQGLALSPGADRTDTGGFGVAAAIDFRLGVAHEGLLARAIGGTDRSAGVTVAWRPHGAPAGTFVVVEGDGGAGVTDARGWRHLRAAAGLEGRVGTARAHLAVLAYDGVFDSPGALREDDLLARRVGFYDGYDGAGEGTSRRLLALGRVAWAMGGVDATARAWGGARSLRLDQSFTGFLQFPDQGDATRQQHDATTAGVRLDLARPWSRGALTVTPRGGLSAGWDGVVQSDDRIDQDGTPWARIADGRLAQGDAAAWAEVTVAWRPVLTVRAGLRAHGWVQRVAGVDDTDPARRVLGTLAPRARLEVRPVDALTLFAGYGRGYRPPRADRGILGALNRADHVQGGVEARPHPDVLLVATGFFATQDDEPVFDHVSARFIGAGATRRAGVEARAEARPVPSLRLDGAVTFADGRFQATGVPIPFAPRWTGSLGIGLHDHPLPRGALEAGLRAWVLGPRPLPEGFLSRTAVTGSARVGWHDRGWGVGVQVDNVFGARWRDGEFVYASAWDPDRPASALPAVHVTAGTPTVARLWLEFRR